MYKRQIPHSVVDSLAKDAGLWFGMGSEGTMTAANDSYGSFVYGTYTITELKTEATRSMKMYTDVYKRQILLRALVSRRMHRQ